MDVDVQACETVCEVRFCMWTDLSYADSEKLLIKDLTPEDIRKMLRETLKLGVAMETGSQAEIALDLFAHGVIFARKNKYSTLQLSTLVSVLKRVHEACISTPFDNEESTMKLLQELLVKHSVERPPYSSSVFSLAQVKDIADYVLSTYFKHFKLYKYAFTKRVRLDLIFSKEPPEQSDAVKPGDTKTSRVEVGEGIDSGEGERQPEETPPTNGVQGEGEGEGEEALEGQREEEKELSSEQKKLRTLISDSINEKLQQLQVTLEGQMEQQQEELLARIATLDISKSKTT